MSLRRTWWSLALLVAVAAPAQGQRALSVWLGVGSPISHDSITFARDQVEAYGALQLDLPLLPVALRGDVSIAGGDLRDGTRNAIASAVFPLRLPLVQPYAMVGYGTYDWGKSFENRGVSYGAGVRVQFGGLGAFVQARRHEHLDRTIATLGLVF